jgi:hypothetical protein
MAAAVEPDHQTAAEPTRSDDRTTKMNNESRGGPARPRPGRARASGLAAALAGVALLAAACGGSPSAGPAAHPTAYQRELAYAQCMRAHGLPSFPDPQSNGAFNSTRANGSDFTGPRFLAANKACAHLEGPAVTAQRFQQDVRGALRFGACMRAHGITNFQVHVSQGSDMISMGIEGPGGEMGSPQFQSAHRACRKLQPGGGS